MVFLILNIKISQDKDIKVRMGFNKNYQVIIDKKNTLRIHKTEIKILFLSENIRNLKKILYIKNTEIRHFVLIYRTSEQCSYFNEHLREQCK